MECLNINNVSAGYGGGLVIWGVTIRVEKGELVTLVGPNGAGKTTTCRVAGGILQPAKGEIIFKGDNVTKLNAEEMYDKGIVYIPQEENIFPSLTVSENLDVAFQGKENKDECRKKLFERFPVLGERSTQKAESLSGGEIQMLGVGSALVLEPDLVIADEPFSKLAPSIAEQILDVILEMKNRGISVLMVSETNPERTLKKSDRGYFMKAGEITKQGSGKELADEAAELMI
ncbi:hypothetical protein AKJ61_03415 [candidate division MSBL1 archaeon SCGC-AAA259B11]|uniref:ABC transporter domain-containing protein n=1 Tax=candidate division MSBL1 archaeon SCGC-AAA259B11 TaxID=1698260 RepID=A0A133U4R3_9EURY|nr:hypothetical protein AKJ61_03415 [candidate division MSBL1 archaeon SCGC-AAA259B11]